MKKTTIRFFVLALLTLFSLGAEAKIDVQIGEFKGGTIKEKSQSGPDNKGLVTVTISVEPDEGYTIKASDITVVSTYPASGSRTNTRAPEIAGNLTLTGNDPGDFSKPRDYKITVDANLGIWVKEANFHSSDKKGGEDVPTRATVNPGVYYIANDNSATGSDDGIKYSEATSDAQKYYLVPADNPQQRPNNNATYEDYRDAYYSPNHASEVGDYKKPFLTTFHTNKDINNKDINSIWIVQKTGDYYYVIHAITGKYVIYEVPLPNDPNKNNDADETKNGKRKTMHLQDPDDEEGEGLYCLSTNNNFQFTITKDNDNVYRFQPRNRSGWYWNPANGNKNKYYGIYVKSAPTLYQSGLVGVFNGINDGGSKWHFEDAKLPAPTIVYDSENDKFTISYDKIPAGFEILYTTDGSDPTIGGNTTQTYTDASEITLETIGENPLKAVVVRYGLILTETAIVRKPSKPTITPTPGDCNNTVTISAEEGTSVYYTIDGTDPTNSSTPYTGPFVQNSNVTIKAVTYSGNLHSEVFSLDYSPNYSNKPTIIQNGANITIEGTGTIYYTTNGSDPDTNSTPYSDSFTLSGNSGDVITVKAVAKDGDKELSCVVERNVKMGYFIGDLSQLEAISSHPSDLCILTDDIDASSLSASISGFTGEFDGGYYTISGLKKPLFDNLNGATVKNVLLDPNATVSGNGAICNEAEGATKIYNCGVLSGTVSGSGNVGGLVGHIKSGSSVRVVNCYNFATVSGGSTMAGIVGNNEGTVGDVRIAMCMMYGDMAGTSPVYAGNHTSNASNFTEYNYWRSKADLTYSTYNDQLAIDKDDYLTRFPFYRHILNSHRELAAFFLFGESGEEVSAITADEVAEIGHWVLNKDVAPYPIIEEWKKNTRKVLDAAAETTTTVDVRKGSGSAITSLNVTVKIGSNSYNVSLPITGMDEANFDYTWGKVVLPFANEFEVNTDFTKICTGWKITGITGGTTGSSFSKYDVSDRDCTSKDLYSTTGFVFAQGGNYIVPYNVTGIEITANFANAYYLSDESYEIGYSGDKTGSNVSGYTGRVSLGGDMLSTFHGETVYHTLAGALGVMSSSGSTHEQAVVLVGNYHQDDEDLSSLTAKGLTIMSIDADNNQEPDYAWYSNNTQDRPFIPPTRFDFVALIPVGMSSRVNNNSFYPGIPIWKPRGWFEMTETSLSRMDQFELDSGNFNTSSSDTRNYRCIINGGFFTQMVRSRKGACSNVKYYQIGGNAYVKEFYPGSHSNSSLATTLCPINVTGGEIEQCFMTGYGKVTADAAATAIGSDIYFWCAGGKIDKFLGAYMEKPRQTSSTDGTVNMTAKIDHAKIGRFFGGGTSPKAQISGNIDVTINNSHVDFYCGGPEFGNVGVANSDGVITSYGTVTTHATGTTFGEYYGAGFGGTAITYTNDKDDNNQGIGSTSKKTVPYPNFFTDCYSGSGKARLKYKDGYGIGSCYKMEFIFNSRGAGSVARFYTGYANFDLATTGNVTNELTGCTVNNDYYGAGCQGKVNGTVTSTLNGCTIKGSAFGGGFKATANEVDIYPTSAPEMSVYTRETGIFSDFGTVEPEKYTWKQGTNEKNNKVEGTTLYTGTNVTLADLGNVTGAISITIDGGSIADDVFGGGNESKSLNNTTVSIENGAQIAGSVYGGGNLADVKANTEVIIGSGTIGKNVFGGGKGKDDNFTCDKAMVGVNNAGAGADLTTEENKNKGTKVTISNGTVNGNVYGGGEVGRVEWNTQVTIGAGEGTPIINGSVFGAGAGVATHGYAALVRGNSTVTIQGNAKVLQNVYGGGEQATVGRYWVKGINNVDSEGNPIQEAPSAPTDMPDEMPYKTMSGGQCNVIVQGSAQVGPDGEATPTAGHVFGAGKGVTPAYVHEGDKSNWSKRMVDYNSTKHTSEGKGTTWDYYEAYTEAQITDEDFPKYVWEYFATEDKYFEFLQTLALVTGTDVTINGSAKVKGSVYGGSESGYVQDNTDVKVKGGTIGTDDLGGADYGNVYGGGKGDADHTGANHNYVAAGLVKGNTKVKIENGTILHNVYGGGAYGTVGEFDYDNTTGLPTGRKTYTVGETVQSTTGGNTEVYITGGTIGTTGQENGMIFGSSRGDVGAPGSIHDKLAWVYDTHVAIGDTTATTTVTTAPLIRGSIYGGGENGHNFRNSYVRINGGTIGISSDATYLYRGNVYGGGCGTDKYDNNTKYNPKAGIVQGNAFVNITGGYVVHNVYGAGAMGSVGSGTSGGKTTVSISGGRIGYDGNGNGNVFSAARGEYGISTAASGLANVRETEVNICYTTTPTADDEDKTVQLITGSVFGGGESGTVKESVAVNMTGGLILKDIYGGGALADTQTSNWDASANNGAGDWATGKTSASATTTVRLTGGTILGEAYGGALGEKTGVNGATRDIEAYVYGDVLLDLNGTTPIDDTTHKPSATGAATTSASGCVVDQIFGCNNVNGSPKGDVMVHVYATQNANATQIANTTEVTTAKVKGSYDVEAVYGGGNMAAYVPVTPYKPTEAPTGAKTQVIIEGCEKTSIETVYGGGNAAAVPETNVDIKGAYEIGYLFGGGNGKDKILISGVLTDNPGADIGQYNNGTETVTYGTGNANSLMEGGLIHEAYGGSNTKGVLKGSINQVTAPKTSTDPDYCCDLVVDKIVGAGKYADIDGDVNMTLSCQPSTKVPLLFAGADEANVNGNITLNITNGYFGQVFGGNNLGGAVKGKITVNVEESGCQPIKIDELYLGGNKAAYSVYGYYESEETHDVTGKKILKPRTAEMHAITDPNAEGYKAPVTNPAEDETHTFPYAQPELNIISCTYIGNVFGGGLGKEAVMYADPTVNVNLVPGLYADTAVPAMMEELHLDVTKTAPNPDNLGIIRNIYGGGDAADIEGNTTVNIATEEGKSAYIIGSVFGGGNAADVLGNTNVTMSGGYVFNGVFGGGYAGNVGTFTRSTAAADVNVFGHTADDSAHEGECIGKPISCKEGTGLCTVVVDGGQIGPISVATQGMNRPEAQGGPVPQGWVWGGGQGLIEDPAKHPDTHFSSYVGSTDVTIGGTALIMESIIGGGEFGRVFGDTKVTITGQCQIGVGEGKVDTNNKPIRYTDDQFVNPLTTTITNDNALVECSHFPYGEDTDNDGIKDRFLPYDPYYDDNKTYADAHDLGPASTSDPSDGKTWIGCVFAGGSGYMPYLKKDNNGNDVGYDWCSSAGLVEGNTELIISGGHILTNVYGGNEVTNVKGKCKISMTGGTIGVPRTVDQIINHPLTCYLFGAGKGDPRPHFNTETNVGEVEIDISGGIIYGSVFGGGEDGHVQRDVKMTIGKDDNTGPVIGTWGTSYVDGNVFGGGRGFDGDAYTAGNVAGCVDLDIKGGTILGSIYGGGRLGSVGYGLYPPTAGDTYYGAMRPDNTGDDADNTPVSDFKRGYVEIEISGGTIGNSYEYIIPSAANTPTGLSFAGIATWTDANWTTWKTHNNIPLTEFDKATYRLKHTKGGNVFAGGMGRLYQLDGVTPITAVNWWKVGCVKQTKLTVKGGTIKSNVYGGGELGVVKPYVNGNTVEGGNTKVIVQNANATQIGTEVKDGSNATQYTFGSVYGGGYGSTIEYLGTSDDTSTENDNPKFVAGLVHGDTEIDMQGGKVLASVYGGGEVASVNGSADVKVSGGEVGKDKVGNQQFGGPTMGNVYGGGSGHPNIVRCGRILKNTKVTISGTDTKIYHNVYGGGAYGTVGDFEYTTGDDGKVIGIIKRRENTTGGNAEVTITGGSIGVDGHENGMVFGSSRGDVNKPGARDDHTAWVYNAFVTIGTSGSATGPTIKGSIYGSGENGHTFNNTVVNIHSGTIGITDKNIDDGARYPNRGNVYGGGCGTDTYTDTGGEYYNNLAGIVYGTATVNMDGGHVVHNVYGAGAMGSVGKFAFDTNGKPTGLENDAPENSGECYINISGGQIGMTGMQMTATGGPDDYGHVFGAGRGELHDPADYPNLEVSGYVNNTNVEISGTAFVTGSVYGGGENGHVLGNTSVTVSGGQIGCGDGETGPYTSGWDGTSMKECASWPYTDNGATYDMYAGTPNYNSEGGSKEATDGHTFYGNVFGGGSGYTPYAAGKWMRSAGRVEGNTSVTITDGHILTNVYGGNEQTDVGNGLSLEAGKGKCTVTMTGGTVGVPRTHSDRLAHPVTGNVFGAGKGDKRVLFNRWTNVGSTEVSISGGTVYGSVFGGGEDGHVLGNAKTTISETSTDKPTIIGTLGTTGSDGNVFGGGRGSVTALTAGVVCGDVSLDILGGMIKGSVYGGGRLASLGTYLVATGDSRYGKQIPDGKNQVIGSNSDVDAPGVTHGHVTINISGGTIGALDGEGKVKVSANSIGDVYGGCKGTTEGTLHDVLGVSTNATINLLGGTVGNAIYGGGEVGNVGELGEGDNPATAFAKINLLGGSVKNVYGGGLGKKIVSQDIDSKAFVKGDVTVNLNGLETGDYDSNIHTMVEAIEEDGVNGVDFYRLPIANRANGCKVLGNIFGCNNVNGTPTGHSKVHVFMTTPQTGQLATEYDISAIYGGGNQADYEPDPNVDNNKQSTEVIIEGCGLTKIQQVYGGGNAAASPGTSVLIKGTELIDEVFGGGNGVSTETFENPGANVGYHTDKSPYAVGHGDGKAYVQLMAGTVHNVYGGSNSNGDIRGGSSITKPTPVWKDGNGVNASCCPELAVDQIFGGGKNADMRSGAEIVLGCMPDDWIGEIYAGAEMANVNGNVSLTLTSGKFGRVFGGNKTSGILNGSITVNIDENGECEVPIVIGELYGGGNMAAYSIYGYEGDEPRTKAQYDALTAEQKAAIGLEHPHESPVVNVHGFTSIGNIFGGGYGEDADLYGNPTVNINEVMVVGNKAYKFSEDHSVNKPTALIDDVNVTLNDHDLGNMGVINNVFGGGNAALVDGNTTVNIATEDSVYVVKLVDVGNSVTNLYKRVKNEETGEVSYVLQKGAADTAEEGSNYYQKLPVQGADIRGNVYGGGNQAEVTGNTDVIIGRRKE